MNKITESFAEIKDEFEIESDGRVKTSIRGAARLLGINEMSIVRGAEFPSKRLAETLMPHGFKAADFSKDGIPDTALALIAKYFAYKANRTTPQAEAICDAFMAIGIRSWVHEQLGWQQSKPKQPTFAYARRVKEIHNSIRDLPEGYWCVFKEASQLLIYVEQQLGYQINETDLLDGSIGIRWSQYRKGKKWAGKSKDYTYEFPDKRACYPKCYPNNELLEFRDWLEHQYKAEYLDKYLLDKYKHLATR